MKNYQMLALGACASLFLTSQSGAQVVFEDFSNPAKLPNLDVAATLGDDAGRGIGPDYTFGTWVYSNANGGIDERGTGAGDGTSINDAITSIGLARAQDFRSTNARVAWVVFESSEFTDGTKYTVSFDVLGDPVGTDAARYWLSELYGYDNSGGNFIQADGNHTGWGVEAGEPKPWTAFGTAKLNYLKDSVFNGVLLPEAVYLEESRVSFQFTYDGTNEPDIGFAVGTYNNFFAIDNFKITAER